MPIPTRSGVVATVVVGVGSGVLVLEGGVVDDVGLARLIGAAGSGVVVRGDVVRVVVRGVVCVGVGVVGSAVDVSDGLAFGDW